MVIWNDYELKCTRLLLFHWQCTDVQWGIQSMFEISLLLFFVSDRNGVSLNGAFEGKLCFHHWIGSVPVSLGLHRPQHAQPLALIRAALNLRWHNSTLNRIKYQIYHWRTFQSNFRFFLFSFSNDKQEAKRINHKIVGRSFTRIFRATHDRSRNFCAFEKYIFFVSFWKAGDNDSPSLIFNVSIHLSILLLSFFLFFFFFG